MANKWKKIPASARFILRSEFSKSDDLPAGCMYKCLGSITLSDSIPLDCEFAMMQYHDSFGDARIVASHYRINSDLLQIYDTEVFNV
jgi:hypothetical protein